MMQGINISQYGGSGVFKWDKDYLFRVLTSGKNPPIKNPKVAAAFRQIDRRDFVQEKFKDQSYQDIDIDMGYGEKFTRPTVLAQMADLLEPRYGGKYLDLGTGTGFMACILGFIAGDQGKIYTMERVQWLWEMARENSTRYPNIRNITFLYRDGSEGLLQNAPFDGIHVSFAMEEVPEKIKMQLVENGKMVIPTTDYNLRVITRVDRDHFEEEIIPGFIFQAVGEGVA